MVGFPLASVDAVPKGPEGLPEVNLPLSDCHGSEHSLLVSGPVGIEFPHCEGLLPLPVSIVIVNQLVLALFSINALIIRLNS